MKLTRIRVRGANTFASVVIPGTDNGARLFVCSKLDNKSGGEEDGKILSHALRGFARGHILLL